jgi:hypothetical protein
MRGSAPDPHAAASRVRPVRPAHPGGRLPPGYWRSERDSNSWYIICSGFAFAAFLGMVSAKALGMSAPEGSRSAILCRLSGSAGVCNESQALLFEARSLFDLLCRVERAFVCSMLAVEMRSGFRKPRANRMRSPLMAYRQQARSNDHFNQAPDTRSIPTPHLEGQHDRAEGGRARCVAGGRSPAPCPDRVRSAGLGAVGGRWCSRPTEISP